MWIVEITDRILVIALVETMVTVCIMIKDY